MLFIQLTLSSQYSSLCLLIFSPLVSNPAPLSAFHSPISHIIHPHTPHLSFPALSDFCSLSVCSVSRFIEEDYRYNQVIWSLPHYFLVASDQQVLTSLENSLKNTESIAQSCHFFNSVLIRDFPPEVFIQSPGIIIVSCLNCLCLKNLA